MEVDIRELTKEARDTIKLYDYKPVGVRLGEDVEPKYYESYKNLLSESAETGKKLSFIFRLTSVGLPAEYRKKDMTQDVVADIMKLGYKPYYAKYSLDKGVGLKQSGGFTEEKVVESGMVVIGFRKEK